MSIDDDIFEALSSKAAEIEGLSDGAYSAVVEVLRGSAKPNAEKIAASLRESVVGDAM
jgi:hypothetical protein